MGVAVTLASAILPAVSASAADNGLQGWRFRTGVICVDTHGWTRWPARESAARYGAISDLNVFAWVDCSSQPVSQRVVLATYNNPNEFACAVTDPGKTLDSGGIVRTMTIRFNMAPRVFNGCHATAAQRAHLMSHELGHALGLSHRTNAVSVMSGWTYQWPTTLDLKTLQGLYPW